MSSNTLTARETKPNDSCIGLYDAYFQSKKDGWNAKMGRQQSRHSDLLFRRLLLNTAAVVIKVSSNVSGSRFALMPNT